MPLWHTRPLTEIKKKQKKQYTNSDTKQISYIWNSFNPKRRGNYNLNYHLVDVPMVFHDMGEYCCNWILDLFSNPKKLKWPLIIIQPHWWNWTLKLFSILCSANTLLSRSISANPTLTFCFYCEVWGIALLKQHVAVNCSLLKAFMCTWHWDRNLLQFKSAHILRLSFQFLLPSISEFF